MTDDARLKEGRYGPPRQKLRTSDREDRTRRDAEDEATIRAHIEGMTPANRAVVEEFIAYRRRRRNSVGTIRKYTDVILDMEEHSNGTPWREYSPDQAAAWVDANAERYARSTLDVRVTLAKAFVRFVNDDRLPRGFRRSFDIGPLKKRPKRRIIAQEHFLAMLDTCDDRLDLQALLWTFWDSGFRREELLSLNVGSVAFDAEGVWLRLPPEDEARFRLKTGPRDVWVIQCAPALKAWLQEHPFNDRPDAPLFLTELPGGNATSFTSDDPDATAKRIYGPLAPRMLYDTLDTVTRNAEVERVTPHDFRHTRAYHCKLNDWADDKMITFFGWSEGSKQPRHYGKLVASDLRDTIRRDAGVNNLGQVVVPNSSDKKLRDVRDALQGLFEDDV